jgi:hypothetical protein
VCIFYSNAHGQFYNGLQMSFGKNRVQYYDFYWQFYRFGNFDCYFNEYGRDLAQFTAADMPPRNWLKLRIFSIIHWRKGSYSSFIIKIPSINNLISDWSLLMRDSYNTGGFNRIIKNKVMLYYEGDHKSFERQIAASITEVIINEMLYNADVKDRIASSSLSICPTGT